VGSKGFTSAHRPAFGNSTSSVFPHEFYLGNPQMRMSTNLFTYPAFLQEHCGCCLSFLCPTLLG